MPRAASLPSALPYGPFRGSVAVPAGLLTKEQLRGPAVRRLFRDVYIRADAIDDHLTLCKAAVLLLPAGAALSHRSAALLHTANILALDLARTPDLTAAVVGRTRSSGWGSNTTATTTASGTRSASTRYA